MPDPQIQPLDTKSVADLLFEGMSVADIAVMTGQAEAAVAVLAENPLTKYMLQKLQAAGAAYHDKSGAFDTEKALSSETEDTFLKIVEIRDTADKPETQLSAAKELFDRQRPKITRTEEERTVRITISRDDVAVAATVEAEMAIIDADFSEEVTKLTQEPQTAPQGDNDAEQ